MKNSTIPGPSRLRRHAPFLLASLLPLSALTVGASPLQAVDSPAATSAPEDVAEDTIENIAERAAKVIRKNRSVDVTHPMSAEDREVRAQIDNGFVDALQIQDLEDLTKLEAVLNVKLAVPVIVTGAANLAMNDEAIVLNMRVNKPMAARTLLDLVTEDAGPEVRWSVRDGALMIGTPDECRGDFLTHLHPIGDLLRQFDADDIATLTQDLVSPSQWDIEGSTIELTPAFLIVRHTRDMQLEVEGLMTRLSALCDQFDAPPSLQASAPSAAEQRWEANMAYMDEIVCVSDFDSEAPTRIEDIAAWIGEVSSFSAHVEPTLLDELDQEALQFRIGPGRMHLSSVLRRMQLQSEDVRWHVQDDTIVFHRADRMLDESTVAFHDVRALVQPTSPAMARSLNYEATDSTPPTVLAEYQLEELIRVSVRPESWDQDPSNSIRIGANGMLTVTQSPRGQAELRRFLNQLFPVAATLQQLEKQPR